MVHPWKLTWDPNIEALEDDVPFQSGDFQVPVDLKNALSLRFRSSDGSFPHESHPCKVRSYAVTLALSLLDAPVPQKGFRVVASCGCRSSGAFFGGGEGVVKASPGFCR